MSSKTESIEGAVAEYVTAVIGGQLFGLPISRVQDVFMPERLTRVPLSSAEIAGVLNLRGRIVTVIDMRARLGLPKNDDGKPPMAVGVDLRGESYGLLIEVTRTHQAKVAADFIRRQTMVNCDRFTTVELQELSEALASAEAMTFSAARGRTPPTRPPASRRP